MESGTVEQTLPGLGAPVVPVTDRVAGRAIAVTPNKRLMIVSGRSNPELALYDLYNDASETMNVTIELLRRGFHKLSAESRYLRFFSPKVDLSDVSKTPAKPADSSAPASRAAPPEKKGFFDKAKEKLGLAKDEPADAELSDGPEPLDEDDIENLPPGGASTVSVGVDNVTLIPGAMASGTVTFSDGVTGKWVVDQYGRPGFTQVSKEGYRPNPADAQAFMQELSAQLQKRGF